MEEQKLTIEREKLGKRIECEVALLFIEWDLSDIDSIYERIVDDVIKDIEETSDYPNYNDSDIRIAVKRVIIDKLSK